MSLKEEPEKSAGSTPFVRQRPRTGTLKNRDSHLVELKTEDLSSSSEVFSKEKDEVAISLLNS